jgi:hypothetical protein
MTTHTIRTVPAARVLTGLAGDLIRATAAISAGWRATRDWHRASVRGNGIGPEQVARELFERNFA